MKKLFLLYICAFSLIFSLPVQAAGTSKVYDNSNEIPGWPQAPSIDSASAVLIDAETGTVLYSKNPHQKNYPASITKILTALLTYENCSLDEVIDFSHDAVFGIPRDSNHIAIDVGEQLTVDEALNGLLIRSANEVALALSEHISGTTSAFADKMNERAKELGALNSHFANPNGLHNDEHYTTAYDMAMIGRAFFDIDYLCEVSITPTLRIYASERQPDDIIDHNKTLLLPGKKYEYENLVGCKTGYTDEAGYTLVAAAEKNGMKLISVVLAGNYPDYYSDIISLFEYGFSNFERRNINDFDCEYIIDSGLFFESNQDILGNSKTLISIDRNASILLPHTLNYEDLSKEIEYSDQKDKLGTVIFSHKGIVLGKMDIKVNADIESDEFISGETSTGKEKKHFFKKRNPEENTVFINIKKIGIGFAIVVAIVLLYFLIMKVLKNFSFGNIQSKVRIKNRGRKERRNILRRKRLRRRTKWRTYD